MVPTNIAPIDFLVLVAIHQDLPVNIVLGLTIRYIHFVEYANKNDSAFVKCILKYGILTHFIWGYC